MKRQAKMWKELQRYANIWKDMQRCGKKFPIIEIKIINTNLINVKHKFQTIIKYKSQQLVWETGNK